MASNDYTASLHVLRMNAWMDRYKKRREKRRKKEGRKKRLVLYCFFAFLHFAHLEKLIFLVCCAFVQRGVVYEMRGSR